MKIVFLDVKTIGDDLDLSIFSKFGEVVKYDFSTDEEALIRSVDADIIITNKVLINEKTIGSSKNLKLVCVSATGTNNLDKKYLDERGIEWRNVAGYSTESVAQHTFAMLFYLLEKLPYYDNYVKSEQYSNNQSFTHFANTFNELSGKTFGIIGLGSIGRRVADIAKLFGANVIYASPSNGAPQEGYNQVSLDVLLKQSDIVSIHSPLNKYTQDLMDLTAFRKMKPTAILLNLGRGDIVVEDDLAKALDEQIISSAALDVLRVEPMQKNSPLLKLKDSSKLLITPHMAWASVESRNRLINTIKCQIEDFLK